MALDSSKANDTARHDVLLAKLSHMDFDCGIRVVPLIPLRQNIVYTLFWMHIPIFACNFRSAGGQYDRTVTFVIYINDPLASLPRDRVMAYADDVTLVAYDRIEAATVNFLHTLVSSVFAWFGVQRSPGEF